MRQQGSGQGRGLVRGVALWLLSPEDNFQSYYRNAKTLAVLALRLQAWGSFAPFLCLNSLMKPLLFLLSLLLLTAFALRAQQPAGIQRLDVSNGFRGLRFGSPLTEALHLRLIQDKGDEKIYERTDEELRVGGFTAARIHYKFFQGRFATVTIIVKGAADAQRCAPRSRPSTAPAAPTASTANGRAPW